MLSGRSGRARVLARRERICTVTSPNGFVGTVLGSVTNLAAAGQGSDVAKCSGGKCHPEKGYVGQAAIPPGTVGQPELVPTGQQRDLNPGLTVLLFASFAIAILPG